MSAIDQLVANNQRYVQVFPGPRPLHPKLKLAVVSCMDSRLDLFEALGLEIGDAHLLRNAGGLPTDDMLRSLAISQRALGTREVAVIHHTNCGMNGFDDEAFRSELTIETDQRPPWNTPGFTDVHDQARRSLDIVRGCGWLPHRDNVRAFVFDVDKGLLIEAT
ncbi:beta-class carbonic anhydrase [uncultured Jatrophihabitans sp.]|uniref:beta-class carbonic anhydrase n=1 Tax=uncultured Jatrophihabitans sp. TaxID=1610747 RepID=UPI0035C9598C